MQAAALQSVLSPLPGAGARAGLTGEPAEEAPDFGQELQAATARTGEIVVPQGARGQGASGEVKALNGTGANERRTGAATVARKAEAGQAPAAKAPAAAAAPATTTPFVSRNETTSKMSPDTTASAAKAQTRRAFDRGERKAAPAIEGRETAAAPELRKGAPIAQPRHPDDGARPAQDHKLLGQTETPAHDGAAPRLSELAESSPAPASQPSAADRSDTRALGEIAPDIALSGNTARADATSEQVTVARMPADTGTVTAAVAVPSPSTSANGADNLLQALPQRLARLAADGVETARIDLDLASAAPVEVRIAREGDQIRLDMTSSDPLVRDRLEEALPAVAAALHTAGLKLADGGVHARMPHPAGAGTPQVQAQPQDADAAEFADAAQDTLATRVAGDAHTPAPAASADAEAEEVQATPAATPVTPDPEPSTREPVPDSASAARSQPQPESGHLPAQAHPGTTSRSASAERNATRAVNPAAERTVARTGPSTSTPASMPDVNTRTARPVTDAAQRGVPATPPVAADTGADVKPPARDLPPAVPGALPLEGQRHTAAAATPVAVSGLPSRSAADKSAATEPNPRLSAPASTGSLAAAERVTASETLTAREFATARESAPSRRDAAPEPASKTGALPNTAEWTNAQALPATANMAPLLSALPEGRGSRTAAAASDNPRMSGRAASPRREPLSPRADLQATASAQAPLVMPMTAPASAAGQTTVASSFDMMASRAVDAPAATPTREADMTALAAGAASPAAPDATFAEALDLATSALPEFMLREALDSADFTPALSARIATLVRDGIEEARIQLNPAEMGPVAVQLAMEGSDVRVDLAAEVESTRQILEQALPSLASALRESGFTLTGGGVFQQPRDTGHGERGTSDGHNGRGHAAPPNEGMTTVSTVDVRRAPRRGLVDLYA